MLTLKIPEGSNGYFHVIQDGCRELLSCYSHDSEEVGLVIEMINSHNEKKRAKTIAPPEAEVIKLDLLIRYEEARIKTKKDNLARLTEELKKEKEQHELSNSETS